MENNETSSQGAFRETLEESGAQTIIDAPFCMVNIAHINQVHLFYRGRMRNAAFAAGEESLEVALVAAEDIPWGDLAFRSVAICLKHYLEDRSNNCFGFHEADLEPIEQQQ